MYHKVLRIVWMTALLAGIFGWAGAQTGNDSVGTKSSTSGTKTQTSPPTGTTPIPPILLQNQQKNAVAKGDTGKVPPPAVLATMGQGGGKPKKKGSKLEIVKADFFVFKEIAGRPIRRLVGSVHVRQDTIDFFCDSAYQYLDSNQIEAFSNVRIVLSDSMSINSQFLQYDGGEKVAEFYRDIVLKRGKTRLFTNRLTYFRTPNYSVYRNGGRLLDGDNVLKSKKGYYYPDDQVAFFRGNVTLDNPKYNLSTDTLGYDTEHETAIFQAPTIVRDTGDNKIYTERGFYDTEQDLALFYQRAYMEDTAYRLHADTFYYDRRMDFGRALGNVEMNKTDSTINVFGHYGEFHQVSNQVMVTDSAYAVQLMDEDTLYLFGDTLLAMEDSVPVNEDSVRARRYLHAIGNVSFFMNDLQGTNDSLVYFIEDSLVIFYKKPTLWSQEQQLKGDTVRVWMRAKKVDSMYVGKKAFLIAKEDSVGFNQIKGKFISTKFKNNKLRTMWVEGNAESTYFARDENDEYMGMNRALCNRMVVRFNDENKPQKITFYEDVTGSFLPMHEVILNPQQLEGFSWEPELRPEKPNWILRLPGDAEARNRMGDSTATLDSLGIEEMKKRILGARGTIKGDTTTADSAGTDSTTSLKGSKSGSKTSTGSASGKKSKLSKAEKKAAKAAKKAERKAKREARKAARRKKREAKNAAKGKEKSGIGNQDDSPKKKKLSKEEKRKAKEARKQAKQLEKVMEMRAKKDAEKSSDQ